MHFELTTDNTSFMRSIREIRDAVIQTSQLIEQIAKQRGIQAEKLADSVEKIEDAVEDTGKAGKDAGKKTEEAFNKVDDSIKKVKKDVESSSNSFAKLAKSAGALFTLRSAQSFAKSIFNVRAEIQSLQTSFRILVGDADKADQLFNSIKEFAVSTPMQMKDLAAAAQTMMGFGLPLEQIMDNLKAIGDISMGDSQRFQALALSFSQMSAAGKLMGQDLMQMINAGFNPLATMAEKTGKSIGTLKDEMSKGAITADMVRQAMLDATSEGGKFNGMLEEQSKTLNGAYSNLQGAIDDMFNSMGEQTEGVFTTAIGLATELVKNFETIGNVLFSVVKVYGAYKAGLLITMALEKKAAIARIASAKGMTSLGMATEICKKKMLALGTVLKSNIWGIALAALTALVDVFGLFGKGAEDAADISEKFGEAAEKATTNANALFAALKNTSVGSKVHRDVIKELQAIYKEYGIEVKNLKDDFSNEAEVVEDLTNKHNDLMLAIRAETIERQKANALQTFSDEYQKQIEDAWGEMKDEIGGEKAGTITASLKLAISEQDLRKLGELNNGVKELGDEFNNGRISIEELHKAADERNAFLSDLEERVKRVGEEFGLSNTKIGIMQRTLWGMGDTVYDANKILQQAINTVNEGANAVEGYGDAADRAAYANRLSKMSVSELQSELKRLVENYNNTTIGVKIVYDEVNVPSWMDGLDLKETRRLAETFAKVLHDNPNAEKFNVNGKVMTRQEVTERAVGYGKSAAQKQAALDAKATAPTTTKTKTTKSKNGSSGLSAEELAEKEFETKAKQTRERERALRDMELSTREAQIKAMKEGTAKTIAQIELDRDKEMEAIKRSYEDLRQQRIEEAKATWDNDPKNKKKNFYASGAYANAASDERYTKEEKENRRERENAALQEYKRQLEEIRKAETASMREYLKEYGSIEQQRLAITEEYEEKIAKAMNDGERLAAKAAMDAALAEFDRKQADVNWESIFGNLTAYTSEELAGFKEQLRKTLSEGNMDVDQYKVIVERIEEINTAILSAQREENSFLGMAIKGGEERKRLTMEEAEARKQAAEAAERQLKAEAAINIAKMDVRSILSSSGVNYSGAINTANSQNILNAAAKQMKGGADSEAYKRLQAALLSLSGTEIEYQKARKVSVSAEQNHANALKKLNTFLGDWKKKLADLMPLFEQLTANISSLPELAKTLGFDENSGVGKAAAGIADTANNAMGAVSDYMSGNYVGAAAKGISAITSLGETLGAWSNSNRAEVEKENNRLSLAMDVNTEAVNRLTEAMKAQSPVEAYRSFEQAVAAFESSEQAARQIMENNAYMYDGGHSLNYDLGGAGGTIKAIFDYLHLTPDGDYDLGGLLRTLSAEQWNALYEDERGRMLLKQLGVKISEAEDDGNYNGIFKDILDFANAYSKDAKDKLRQTFQEAVTGVSFDGFKDNFKSALMDMEKSVHDFGRDFTEELMQSVLNARIEELYGERMQALYDSWEKALSGDNVLTEDEVRALQDRQTALVNDMMKTRNELARLTGYDAYGSEESATFKSASSFTQEQGDILNGRLTAIQMGVAVNNTLGKQMAASLKSMEQTASVSAETNTAVVEIRNMMIISNSFLEDIAKYSKKQYDDFGAQIDRIATKVNSL